MKIFSFSALLVVPIFVLTEAQSPSPVTIRPTNGPRLSDDSHHHDHPLHNRSPVAPQDTAAPQRSPAPVPSTSTTLTPSTTPNTHAPNARRAPHASNRGTAPIPPPTPPPTAFPTSSPTSCSHEFKAYLNNCQGSPAAWIMTFFNHSSTKKVTFFIGDKFSIDLDHGSAMNGFFYVQDCSVYKYAVIVRDFVTKATLCNIMALD